VRGYRKEGGGVNRPAAHITAERGSEGPAPRLEFLQLRAIPPARGAERRDYLVRPTQSLRSSFPERPREMSTIEHSAFPHGPPRGDCRSRLQGQTVRDHNTVRGRFGPILVLSPLVLLGVAVSAGRKGRIGNAAVSAAVPRASRPRCRGQDAPETAGKMPAVQQVDR